MATTNINAGITEKPVWFITGCSTGFGHELAKYVLERGYRTVVTARNPHELKEFEGKEGALILTLPLQPHLQPPLPPHYPLS